jgi:hypothetical protein
MVRDTLPLAPTDAVESRWNVPPAALVPERLS